MRVAYTLLVVLLASCAADEEVDAQPTARVASRPVLVQASSELSDECMEALVDDVLWYRDRGATLALSVVEPDAPSILGVPVSGVVAVHRGEPTDPDALAETWRSLTVGGNVFYADVTLRTCDRRAESQLAWIGD